MQLKVVIQNDPHVWSDTQEAREHEHIVYFKDAVCAPAPAVVYPWHPENKAYISGLCGSYPVILAMAGTRLLQIMFACFFYDFADLYLYRTIQDSC